MLGSLLLLDKELFMYRFKYTVVRMPLSPLVGEPWVHVGVAYENGWPVPVGNGKFLCVLV